jgi:hypothetical protein
VFLIVFFWLWPTITEISIWKFGSIKTNVEQARIYLSQLRAIEGEVSNIKAQIEAEAKSAKELQNELARLKAPRALTSDQIERMIAKLRPFAGQQFGMVTYWNTKEPREFTQQIGDAVLLAAGWKFVRAESFEVPIGVMTDIEVQLSSQASDTAKQAAQALVSAFNAEEVRASFRDEPTYTTKIEILVGVKP